MPITNGEIAELARQVVDQIDPTLGIVISPADPVDPYRWESGAWTVTAGRATSYVTAAMSPEEALAKLTEDLQPG
ncbi:hypothetical protein SAMN05892883_3777 [Jatrophihabitans sp. GAS493]|uniref:hypothetical protein n=1 Tax=Jatrophihabitans sp. GAS493 TaxID=1907575 RepID=UPI000BB8F386|nr:hypothetical protein [Jatrophihabitans sp. GAS493]SOD74591.1 hypothetical protein SAMN05892883_3777 [Jatrophihabitans sp. GAS493]